MNVNIILVDVLDATAVGSLRADITARVKSLYGEGVTLANAAKPSPGHTFSVQFATTVKPAPTGTDNVIYFLPSDFFSIIDYDEKKVKHSLLLNDHWGRTVGTPSATAVTKVEIACKMNNAGTLGALVVHEILHMRTGKDNKTLHKTGGVGGAKVDDQTAMNPQNRRDIADTITRNVAQWTGGFDILVDLKKQRDSGDPAWNLF